jgi:hypothetical protein
MSVVEIQAACNLMPQFRVHGCREANRVAHELAKMGMQKRDCVVMHFSVPGEIRGLVQGEAVESQGVLKLVTSFLMINESCLSSQKNSSLSLILTCRVKPIRTTWRVNHDLLPKAYIIISIEIFIK